MKFVENWTSMMFLYVCDSASITRKFVLILLYLSTVHGVVHYSGPVNVNEGEQFTITCNASLFAYIKWRLNETSSSYIGELSTVARTDHEFISNVTIIYASPIHTGTYKCSYGADDFGHNVTVIAGNSPNSIVLNHSGSICNHPALSPDAQCAIGKPFAEFFIMCSSSKEDMKFIWWFQRNKTAAITRIEKSDRIEIEKSNLKFKSLDAEDAGTYFCRMDGNASSIPKGVPQLELHIQPYVPDTKKDLTFTEGHDISLNCSGLASDPSTVVWMFDTLKYKNNITLEDAEDKRIIFDHNIDNLSHNRLIIKEADMNVDRGFYYCSIKNNLSVSEHTASFFVRVKSKYSMLLPSILIVAQVILLFIIICVFEKIRDRSEMDESDTDQGPESKNNSNHDRGSQRT